MKNGYFLMISLLFLAAGCKKDDTMIIENLNGGMIRIFGHGGIGFDKPGIRFPENAQTSIEKAIAGHGVDGLEVDVQLSKDNTIYLFHNDVLESTTDCEGCIPMHTSQYLTSCRYNNHFHISSLQHQTLYTLEEVLVKYASAGICFLLDIKNYMHCLEEGVDPYQQDLLMVDEICRLTELYGIEDRIYIELSHANIAKQLKNKIPQIKTLLNANEPPKDLLLAAELGMNGIVIRNNLITKDQVKKAHKLGLEVCLFGIFGRADTKEAIEKHPDIMLTDNIRLAQEMLMHVSSR